MYRILWRQRYFSWLIALICTASAIIYLRTVTKLYRATAGITVEPLITTGDSGRAEDPSNDRFLSAQRDRLISKSVLALALTDDAVKPLETFRNARNRLAALRKGLTAEVETKDRSIAVSFECPYPKEAVVIANAVVDAYIQYQTQPRKRSAGDVLLGFHTQMEESEKQLASITAKMQAIEEHYGVLSAGNETNNIILRQLTTLSEELAAAQVDALKARMDDQAAQRSLPKTSAAPLASTGRDGVISTDDEASLRAELKQSQAAFEDLRHRYLPGHPALKTMQRRIDELNRSYVAAVQARSALAASHVIELQKAIDQQQARAIEISARTAEYGRLASDAERSRRTIDNLASRISAIESTRDGGIPDIESSEHAQDAILARPQKAVTLLAGLFGGILLGCLCGLLREFADDRLRSPERAESALGLQVLGAVPHMASVVSATVAAQKTALDPKSEVADAYRAIRAAIFRSAPDDRSRTILVTSPAAGEGKTTSATNLAIAMAQAGRKVLLIDADLHCPALHNLFGLRQTSGLATVLSGRTSAVEKAIQHAGVEGLSILPCGPAPRNPSELLNNPAFPGLLEYLAEKYDQVIIDAPPVLGIADSRIIAASCDLTILVLRAGRSTRRRSVLARNCLTSVGARLLGAIVTHAHRGHETFVNGHFKQSKGEPAEAAAHPDPDDIIDMGASPA